MPIQAYIQKSSAYVLAAFGLLLCAALIPATATAAGSPEDKVKAAIVYKVTKFVTWPKKKQTLTICVLGEGPINHELKKIHQKNSLGRRLTVTHKDPNAPFEKLCDILYIHSTSKEITRKVLTSLKGKPILTVSDTRSFAENGGIVGLKRQGKKMSFYINSTSSEAAGLNISSQLMGLAKVIQ